jgi:sugar phosphate isomerase/epimerase
MAMDRILDFCEEHQFNALELNTNDQNFNLQSIKEPLLERISRMSNSGNVHFTIHPSHGVNFSDPHEENRKRSLDTVEEAIGLAARIGIKTIPIHPGNVNGTNTAEEFAEAVSHTVSGIRRCAETARRAGVRISVENLCHVKGTVAPDVSRFLTLCESIGLSLIGITLDTGHAALVDGLEKTLSVIGRHVDHIHLDDTSGRKSDHLELGTGTINFPAIAGYLRAYSGILNIELKIPGEDHAGPILRSREYLKRLLAITVKVREEKW